MPIHLRLKDGFCPKQFLHRCWYSDLHNHVSPPFAFITIAIIAEDVSAHIIGLFRRLCSMIGQEMFTILQKGRLKNISTEKWFFRRPLAPMRPARPYWVRRNRRRARDGCRCRTKRFSCPAFCGGEIVGGIVHHHAVGRVGLHGGAYGEVGRFGGFVEQAKIVRAEQCVEAVG